MKTKLFTLLLFCNLAFAQVLTTSEINKNLGRGVNLGNMFEAPSETEWGNPFKDEYFEKIAKMGFNHVRIPIRWDVASRCLKTSPYTINKTFLDRIKYVVGKAQENKLMVIMNMHHHEDLFKDPAANKERFLSQWAQIAENFKNYNQNVLFEVMNEPNTNLTSDLWNIYFKDALSEIRKTNPTRAVLIGTSGWGGLGGLPTLKVPDDKNLILTIHYYNPFNFTHQGADWVNGANDWLGTKWEDLQLERDQINSEFNYLIDFAKTSKIPVNIGEFGAFSKADIESRVKWTTFLARWFEQQGFSWAYWEFSAGFGVYNPTTGQNNQQILDALVKNVLQSPKVVDSKLIYQSDFSTIDGWNLGVQPTSTANLINSDKLLKIDVKSASKDSWHVQLTKNNIAVSKGKRYVVYIKGKADKSVSVTNYVGKNGAPYNSYSGYSSINFTTNESIFSYTFIMTDPTDNAARINFDLGSNIANIEISLIKIEEIIDKKEPEKEVLKPLSIEDDSNKDFKIFPNPVSKVLNLEIYNDFESLQIIDSKGFELMKQDITNNKKLSIDLSYLNAGSYIINFSRGKYNVSKRIFKL